MTTLFTFGDSILDCEHYNDSGISPGGLIVRNDDRLFPEFRGRDLESRGTTVLEHRAVDGATVDDLLAQARGLVVVRPAIALITIGGNDLLAGLLYDEAEGLDRFEALLTEFLRGLPIRPAFLGNVYDPTFGDDARNFLDIDPRKARFAHYLVNRAIVRVAEAEKAVCVDLHSHFLTGDPSWLVKTIEPSLEGASEVRRCFLDAILGPA